ncbi:MAG: type II secretion system F family protein [Limisphaerales bacterium]
MAFIISPRQLVNRAELYHQLAMLVSSGIPMINVLEMMERNPVNTSARKAMANVAQLLREGHTITEAFAEAGKCPEFDAALIEAGDKSGRLDQCFKLLSLYYTERAQTLRSVISGLLYPMFMFHMAVFIFPFIEFFRTSNLTKFILQTVGILLPIYAVVGFVIYACQARHGEKWRSMIEKIANPIPILGTARRQLALARLSAALEALLNAGVPIISGWELAATASGSPALRRTVTGWRMDLERGSTPAELVTSSRAFPEPFVNLYQTGEVSGQLDEALTRLHVMYRDEGSRNLKLAGIIFPKIVYGCVALLVAWKVVSFYLGYFQTLNDVMNMK